MLSSLKTRYVEKIVILVNATSKIEINAVPAVAHDPNAFDWKKNGKGLSNVSVDIRSVELFDHDSIGLIIVLAKNELVTICIITNFVLTTIPPTW